MTGKISLTASMRNNLLSLQNISRQVSATQNKLATGNKVNSAIDNPSSYYTAHALNNRADDLNALLDSMGQAISTIKAATTALETGAAFLEQAAAVATQALETATIPAKSYFEEKVGENGAVVTTAQELKDAVASGKETICVYGKIDYFENESFILQDNQKLVGTEYFTGYTGRPKFSRLNFINKESDVEPINAIGKNIISDLSISYQNETPEKTVRTISGHGNTIFRNLDIKASQQGFAATGGGAISIYQGTGTFEGTINIEGSGDYGAGIYLSQAQAKVTATAQINIKTNFNVINTAFWLLADSTLDIYGQLNLQTGNSIFRLGDNKESGNTVNIHSSTEINGKTQSFTLLGNSDQTDSRYNKLNIEKGSAIYIDDGATTALLSSQNSHFANLETKTIRITAQTLLDSGNFQFQEKEPFLFPEQIINEYVENKIVSSDQYASVLFQYDSLIADASYKGINLLQNERLNVNFNESRSASLNVQGKDMSSAALGLVTFAWQTQEDVVLAVKELTSALKSIRTFSAELGNNYSMITSRQDFTENLINILTEGADKLTLADMNEESANMLALQTRQQLAVNSLSLASQTSQSVLRLF